MTELDRRAVLRGACVGCAGLALAACSGSSPGSSAAAPSASSPSAAGSPAPAKPLAVLADLKVGTSVAVKTPDGRNLLMTRTSPTTVVAFSARCTHQGCTVEPDGKRFACPCHGSIYDAFTGKNISGPAPSPLPPFAVKVSGTDVVEA
jgi:cytochrome b6-f complex iron-sulfur subunit